MLALLQMQMLASGFHWWTNGPITFRVYLIKRRLSCPGDECFAGPKMKSGLAQPSPQALALISDQRLPG